MERVPYDLWIQVVGFQPLLIWPVDQILASSVLTITWSTAKACTMYMEITDSFRTRRSLLEFHPQTAAWLAHAT